MLDGILMDDAYYIGFSYIFLLSIYLLATVANIRGRRCTHAYVLHVTFYRCTCTVQGMQTLQN